MPFLSDRRDAGRYLHGGYVLWTPVNRNAIQSVRL
jgi:hypothetical protein